MHRMGKKLIAVLGLTIFLHNLAFATTYDVPSYPDALIGQLQQTRVGFNNITDIDQKYDVGYYAMVEANPGVNVDNLKSSQTLVIPTQFLLPDAPRKDIVVNVAEMRLYYYIADQNKVMTFPIGIGKQGRNTPVGKTYVVAKAEDPEWNPTPQVRDDFLRLNGYPLPKLVMPGPDNPLGKYAMILGLPTYLIHGSIDPAGIGRRSSAGCIRMFNEDVGTFYPMVVPKQTGVMIVYQPYKAGWSGNTLYFEAHTPIPSDYETPDYRLAVQAALKQRPNLKVKVNWDRVAELVKLSLGIPQPITE